jgi:2-oxoglutarate ferredoxin oxidoreductase subunit beta
MKKITKPDDYNSGNKCTWCSGCGNFAIWYMLKQALYELKIDPHEVVIVYGVGCAGNATNLTEVYGFHGLHGRAIPLATGIKQANNKLKVIVMGGDGDGMGIGVGHFIHAARRNVDITYLLHDNQIYGLTTGQTSPRSDKGMVTKTSPSGNYEEPVNPLSLALSSKCSFVARAFSGSPRHLKDVIKEAIQHEGFSFVDVLQPCITFNKINTYAWFSDRLYDINKEKNYMLHNVVNAYERSLEWGEKIPMGIFYKESRDTLDDFVDIKNKLNYSSRQNALDISEILSEFEI